LHGTYFTLAPGGTIEYSVWKHVAFRVDYEFQIWPGFSGIAAQGNNGLTPNGFSLGVSYMLRR
jgi:hypothetical protein